MYLMSSIQHALSRAAPLVLQAATASVQGHSISGHARVELAWTAFKSTLSTHSAGLCVRRASVPVEG